MLIIPALYLVDGRCVSPYKGDESNLTVFSANPLQDAKRFLKQGATHILVMDGNKSPDASKKNRLIAEQIIKNTDLKVIFADGVKSLDEVAELLDMGVAHIALGDVARPFLSAALSRFGDDKIWFLIRGERNLIRDERQTDVLDYGKEISDMGVHTIVFWDTKTEGTFHPNFDEVDRLILGTPANIIAFGGIGSMSDITLLKKTGAAGVIISRALFEHRISLSDCV